MRANGLFLVLFVAVLLPRMATAQVYQSRTPPPEVTAAAAPWQVNGEPVIVGGIPFFATREMRTFDGEVMTQIGVYGGVPIYADTTLEPYSIIYVPISRNRMRTYERLRDRDLVGTTGSRTPTFPVAPTSALDADASRESIFGTPIDVGPTTPRAATSATTAPARVPPPAAATTGVTTTRDIPRTRVESIPKPNTTDGIWLVFDAARWYSAGPAVVFDHARFTKIGEYRGFPVYRERNGASNRIWVAVVHDGPVAPYEKR